MGSLQAHESRTIGLCCSKFPQRGYKIGKSTIEVDLDNAFNYVCQLLESHMRVVVMLKENYNMLQA